MLENNISHLTLHFSEDMIEGIADVSVFLGAPPLLEKRKVEFPGDARPIPSQDEGVTQGTIFWGSSH
jgi:hypothetical protein